MPRRFLKQFAVIGVLKIAALLIHGMNQQRLEVTKLTLKLADSNWEIFNSYPNSATPK